jgi:CRISPR/Cas system-associated exonuclease Cas4 (RecB family)
VSPLWKRPTSLKKNYFLKGVVDCILESPGGSKINARSPAGNVVVDFKTGNTPGHSDYTSEEGLKDFQLPMYLRLSEPALNTEARTALFYSIINASAEVLFGSIKNTVSGVIIPKREKDIIDYGSVNYEKIMNEFDEKAERFALEIAEARFSVYPEYSNHCADCEYNKVCRVLYKVKPGKTYG